MPARRIVRSSLMIMVVAWVTQGRAQPPTFFEEWRAASNARLAQVFPRGRRGRAGPSQVAVKTVAEVLGVSKPRVSMMLTGSGRLGFPHAETLARHAGVTAEYILAADALDRFASAADLVRALDGERSSVVHYFVVLYSRRFGPRLKPNGTRPLRDSDFVLRWRRTIKRRIKRLVPGQVEGYASLRKLAVILGVDHGTASRLVNLNSVLTYAHAQRIGAACGVPPEWVLAAEMLDAFETIGEVEHAFRRESKTLRALGLRLYADRKAGCAPDLARPRAPLGR